MTNLGRRTGNMRAWCFSRQGRDTKRQAALVPKVDVDWGRRVVLRVRDAPSAQGSDAAIRGWRGDPRHHRSAELQRLCTAKARAEASRVRL